MIDCYLHHLMASVIKRKGIWTLNLWIWRPLFYHWNHFPKKNGGWYMEFAPICVYLEISLLYSLISIGTSFVFASSSSLAYPNKWSTYEYDFDPFDDAIIILKYSFILILFYLSYLIGSQSFILFGKHDWFTWILSMNYSLWNLTVGFLYFRLGITHEILSQKT